MSSNDATALTLTGKLTYVFNKFLLDFIRSLNQASGDLKAATKKHYRVIDKHSEEFFRYTDSVLDAESIKLLAETQTENVLDLEKISGMELLKELAISTVLQKGSAALGSSVRAYLYTFALLVHMNRTEQESETGHNILSKILGVIKSIQDHTFTTEDLDEVIDDDYRMLLTRLFENEGASPRESEPKPNKEDGFSPNAIFESLENTTIGALAKEISEETDISSLKLERPEDLLNLANFESLAKGENTVIGSIISKVGSKIQSKLQNGELKQEQLLSEAFGFMNTLSGAATGASQGGAAADNPLAAMMNNPMLKSMLSGLGGAAASAAGSSRSSHTHARTRVNESKVREASARERLRRKVEQRNKKNDA